MQHTGERPYLCTLCPKMFTRLTYLKEHMNSHTEQTPFLCPHCSESFQERAVFTKHVKRHQAARNANRSQQQASYCCRCYYCFLFVPESLGRAAPCWFHFRFIHPSLFLHCCLRQPPPLAAIFYISLLL